MATIASLLTYAETLQQVSDTPRLDVEILLSVTLNVDRSFLYTWPEQALTEKQLQIFMKLLQQRQAGKPIAHLTGQQEFWSLNLSVNSSTLIPRPETELLVEVTLDKFPSPKIRALDLGTGTGAIALALAKERPTWSIVAVDSIPAAVDLAQKNANAHGISNVQFFESNWFSQITTQELGPFDAIISNPPYIAEDDLHLQQGDVQFEPASALTSGNHGLADLELIIQQSAHHLASDGWLLLEHGFQQGAQVRSFFGDYGYQSIETLKDLSGQERVSLAKINH